MPLTPEQTAQLQAAIEQTVENLVEALIAGGPSEPCVTQASHILKSIQSAAARGRGGPVGPSPEKVVLAHGNESVITTRTHNMLRQLNMISTTS